MYVQGTCGFLPVMGEVFCYFCTIIVKMWWIPK